MSTILLLTSAAPKQTPFSTTEKRPPVGMGFLISALKSNGHTVHFVDNYLALTDIPNETYLKKNNIEFVGIYVNTICLRHALKMMWQLELFRRTGTWKGKIIVGGPHTTVSLETIPHFVDFIVQGEGERAICDIVEGKVLERVVHYERIKNLDSLPMPAWEYFVNLPYDWNCSFFPGKPVFTMNTSRGCPFNCSFCSVCSIWGKEYTMFSAQRILNDIEFLFKTYNAKGIYFREDNFTLNKRRVVEFCNGMIERGYKLPWVCETRVNTLSRELIRHMAEAGVKGLYFGVESGSQRMLDFLKKGISIEQIRQAFAWCHEFSINTAASIVVGIPGETEKDLELTQALLKQIKPSVTWYNAFVGIPKSPLYQYTIDNGLYEFIDDRGLVYLKGHDKRAKQFYGGNWDASVPVKFEEKRVANPLVSVVMPVYNGERYLKQTIDSVLKQSEQNFEFIIINDGSTDSTQQILTSISDRRIKLIHNDSNLGVTASLIRGMAEVQAEYVARIDCGDQMVPYRLELQVEFLKHRPDYALVGSSFYQIDASEKYLGITQVLTDDKDIRCNLDKQNWFCHGSVMIRKNCYLECGGYDPAFKYAQDYDLWLRMAERYSVANIIEPLYFWRNDALGISNLRQTEQSRFAQLARQNSKERLASKKRIVSEVKEPELVSVIVPTYNRPEFLVKCLNSILQQTYHYYEIVVVNDSGQPMEHIISKLNAKRNIVYACHSRNRGLAAARNSGIRISRGSYIAYLDDDDVYCPDHLEKLVSFIEKENAQIGYSDAVMAKQKKVNGAWTTIQRSLIYSYDFDYDHILVDNFIPVLCFVHKRECIDRAGFFDESLKNLEDWDMWIRMSRHYKMHHLKQITAEYSMREGDEQMTTSATDHFLPMRKKIYSKYASLTDNMPHIQERQKKALETSSGIVQQKRVIQKHQENGELRQLIVFLKQVMGQLEKGNLDEALLLYNSKRSGYKVLTPEIEMFDSLIGKLQKKTDKASKEPLILLPGLQNTFANSVISDSALR